MTKGIHASLTWWSLISQRPTSLTTPLATMNEVLSPASRSSEVRRPSRFRTTIPHTMPSGSPLAKIASAFHSPGRIAKRSSATSAAPMRASSAQRRCSSRTSDTHLIPRYLLNV